MKTLYVIELFSKNLNNIIEFKAVQDDEGVISVYAENDNIKEFVLDCKLLSFQRFQVVCRKFANTFELNQ